MQATGLDKSKRK